MSRFVAEIKELDISANRLTPGTSGVTVVIHARGGATIRLHEVDTNPICVHGIWSIDHRGADGWATAFIPARDVLYFEIPWHSTQEVNDV